MAVIVLGGVVILANNPIYLVLLLTASMYMECAYASKEYQGERQGSGIDKQRYNGHSLSRMAVGGDQHKSAFSRRSGNWPLGELTHQLLIVNEPISNEHILPFAEKLPNTQVDSKISMVAALGEYEPVSFVLRSGSEPLKRVVVSVSELVNTNTAEAKISSDSFDVRLVKSWYQAGSELRRDGKDRKRLVPELLLHDNNLVIVDYENEVNLIPNVEALRDAEYIRPFDVPSRFNQQVWVTSRVPVETIPGIYRGSIEVEFNIGKTRIREVMAVELKVLPFRLSPPLVSYAMFYEGRLNEGSGARVSARSKNKVQMLAEFRDMRAHGLTDVALVSNFEHVFASRYIEKLGRSIELMKNAGFDSSSVFYVDWEMTSSETASKYERKIRQLKEVAERHGYRQLYVYNQDEWGVEELLGRQWTFEVAKGLGVKNFVATNPKNIHKLSGLLDIAVLHRNQYRSVRNVKNAGIEPWAYGFPQAGRETPFTYRDVYGVKLWLDGFEGACAYAYQTGPYKNRSGWDDWASEHWRPHVMAYPTLSEPIPTLQWEGWREGVDDVRYVATLFALKGMAWEDSMKPRHSVLEAALGGNFSSEPGMLRRQIIKALEMVSERPTHAQP